jgi:hypothetical protein
VLIILGAVSRSKHKEKKAENIVSPRREKIQPAILKKYFVGIVVKRGLFQGNFVLCVGEVFTHLLLL